MTNIKLFIKSEEELYESYSEHLNKSLIDYLIEETMFKNDIVIEVNTNVNINNLDMLIKNGINSYYDNLILKDRFYDTKQIFNTIAGIILLILSSVIKVDIFRELLIIAGWVAIWDVIDYTFNKNMENHRKKKTLKRLMNAKIIIK